MAVSDWQRAAESGFKDREALAKYLGALKPNENVPAWLKRMADRLAVRLVELVEITPTPARA
jgi:hypothetical protein